MKSRSRHEATETRPGADRSDAVNSIRGHERNTNAAVLFRDLVLGLYGSQGRDFRVVVVDRHFMSHAAVTTGEFWERWRRFGPLALRIESLSICIILAPRVDVWFLDKGYEYDLA